MSNSTQHFLGLIFRILFTFFGAIAEFYAIGLLLDKRVDFSFILIIIGLSLIIYLFDFFEEFSLSKRNKRFLFILFTVFLLLSIFFFIIISFENIISVVFSFALLALGLLYNNFFKKITAKIPGFKDVFVALMWNMTVVLFFIFHGYSFNLPAIVLLVLVFSRDFINISYCDIKDISPDKERGLLTFAVIMGRSRLIKMLNIISIVSAVIITILVLYGVLEPIFLSFLLPIAITAINVNNTHSFSANKVDLEYFFWLGSIGLLRILRV